ncbi:hypothetical protein OAF54_03520, partial [bacterium]|nr:hypothetical protein [bacterium]
MCETKEIKRERKKAYKYRRIRGDCKGKICTVYPDGTVINWMKGSGFKKYKVVVYKKDGTKKTVSFGDKR